MLNKLINFRNMHQFKSTKTNIQSFNTLLDYDIFILFKNIFFKLKFLYDLIEIKVQCFSFYITYPMKRSNTKLNRTSPSMCLDKNYSYSGFIYIALNLKVINKISNIIFISRKLKIILGKLPIILKSTKCYYGGIKKDLLFCYGVCPFETGGYFIIKYKAFEKGTERSLLIQEISKPQLSCFKFINENILIHKTKSYTNNLSFDLKIIFKKGSIFLNSCLFKKNLSISIILLSFGLTRLIELYRKISYYPILFTATNTIFTFNLSKLFQQNTSLKILYSNLNPRIKKIYSLNSIANLIKFLNLQILPNTTTLKNDFTFKIVILLHIINRGLDMVNNLDLTHNYLVSSISRYLRVGNMLIIGLSYYIRVLLRDLSLAIRKRFLFSKNLLEIKLDNFLKSDFITQGIEYSIITGVFKNNLSRVLIQCCPHIITRYSHIGCMSALTKVHSKYSKKLKILNQRSYKYYCKGRLCPIETPEGESCGLINNLTVLSIFSVNTTIECIFLVVETLGLKRFTESIKNAYNFNQSYKIFINDSFIGFHENMTVLIYYLRKIRSTGFISIFFNFNATTKIFIIRSDEGRILKKSVSFDLFKLNFGNNLILTHTQSIKYTFKDFLVNGLIELLDFEEESFNNLYSNNLKINYYQSNIQLDSFSQVGFNCNSMPFIEHNQSPRNIYHTSMQKQNISFLGFFQLLGKAVNIDFIWYPQEAIISTSISHLIGLNIFATAQNLLSVIMSYSHFDLEDALILNNKTRDYGGVRCLHSFNIRVLELDAKHLPISRNFSYLSRLYDCKLSFEKLVKQKKTNNISYKKLKLLKLSHNKIIYEDYINNILEVNSQAKKKIQISCTKAHLPDLGDKLASRYGQKGIIGNILSNTDVPFGINGILPDLIVNPNGFPSRMTIGQLYEILLSTNSLSRGSKMINNSFSKNSKTSISLKDAILDSSIKGFSHYGKFTFINGTYGKIINTKVYFGPVFYQKLIHLANNKIGSRNYGKNSFLTKQPIKGKKQNGGLRIGEMEKDCLFAYGCGNIIIEKLLKNSDRWYSLINRGGMLEQSLKQTKRNFTHLANSHLITVPYSLKLMQQEILSTSILIRIVT